MRADIRSGSRRNVLFGDVDGVQIIGLSDSRCFDSSPMYGPEAMHWAYIRGGSHGRFSLKVRHEMLVG